MESINVSEFKARCLSILDEVARTGKTITICKRGKPLARIVPPAYSKLGYPQETLRGTLTIVGDIVSPVMDPEDWSANRGVL
ncbi:MAG: type II toxin-antitoxin system prevent-host-death family antitoxin [Betaproteobacteria bacterium]|nr:type II toxin-antitoxin system prevent-host-death family antitoxin [Betaproteobacteria bacterium]